MKIYKNIFILYFFVLVSCNNLPKSKSTTEITTEKNNISNDFTFDVVEHYFTTKNDSMITNISKKMYENLTLNDKMYLNILQTEIPENLSDKKFITNLEKLNFKKVIINSSKNEIFLKVFKSEFCSEFAENACIPMYRDIYIFKKENQIIAIAKICFECQIIYFVSKTKNWQRFGECESFITLEGI